MYGGRWNVIPSHTIGANTIMRSHLEFDSGQDILKGALIYKIQEYTASDESSIQNESDHPYQANNVFLYVQGEYTNAYMRRKWRLLQANNQSLLDYLTNDEGAHVVPDVGIDDTNGDIALALIRDLIRNESKQTQLLVVWNGKHTEGLHVRALLIEHDWELDEEKLRKLHQRHWHLLETQVDTIKSKWLLNDTTVLETSVNVMNEGHRWDIYISEGIGDNVNRPLWINTKR
jgi:hypothetical protein